MIFINYLLLSFSIFSKLSNSLEIRGVSNENLTFYQPDENNNWHCLNNPEIILSFDKINDNYCDCPDGSDEPGTSACKNSYFYCENKGFKPNLIPSFKIDDGICDYDICCDGSDEITGICENKCNLMKIQYDKDLLNHNKLISDGLLIKNKLIENSKLKKIEIDNSIKNLNNEINLKILEIENLENNLKSLNNDKNNDLINNNFKLIENDLNNLNLNLINSFNNLNNYILKLETLENILKQMTNNYNHNFNDPAVKQAANDYLNFAASIDEINPDSNESQRFNLNSLINSFNLIFDSTNSDLIKVRDEMLNLNNELNNNNNNNNNNNEPIDSSLISDLFNGMLISLKKISNSFLGIESHKLNNDLNDNLSNSEIEEKIKFLQSNLNDLNNELNKLEIEKNKNYGPDDILRSIPDCIDSKIGNYIYRLCPNSILEQINNDDRSTKIGIFNDFSYSNEIKNFRFKFDKGARCWNGPVREAIIDLTCGLKNEIISVTEPEKCIYYMKMSSPLGCFESDLL